MAPILNTQTGKGLPLCLSGITHPTALFKEMADHDRRRKGFKKSRSRPGTALQLHATDQDDFFEATSQRIHHRDLQVEGTGEVPEDLAAVALLLRRLSCISLSSCTAKAA